MQSFFIIFLASIALNLIPSFSNASQANDALNTIQSMAGCYLVDYSFKETKALKPGYTLDARIYDVNRQQNVYEWIVPIQKSESEIRLQHFLMIKNLQGAVTLVMKHQAEDWQSNAATWFNFKGPGHWEKEAVTDSSAWVRKVTNLDDGLRYQCAAAWNMTQKYPEWSCANFAPIPGRETRDMGRKDYNTLDRKTRIIAYGNSWLERQQNVKTIFENGSRTTLAEEDGKNWFVKVPSEECAPAEAFFREREVYFKVLQETWDDYLSQHQLIQEMPIVNGKPRFAALMEVEEKYAAQLQANPALAETVKKEILEVIRRYQR